METPSGTEATAWTLNMVLTLPLMPALPPTLVLPQTNPPAGYAPAVAKYLRAEKGQRDKYVWMYSEEDSSGQNKILYTNSKQIEAFYKGHVLYPANGMQGAPVPNPGLPSVI